MTEKEKEKAYDEAIERAKKSYGNGIAEEIFPELYESEDEMIKTAILNLLKIWRNYKDYVCGVHVEDAIAWLEKQGKNSADKIEPRFKVGDWVVFITNKSVYQVEKKENYEYTLRNIFGGSLCLSFSKEELIREWTIQDARDGDVLFFYSEYKSHKMTQVGIIEKYVGKHGGCSNTFKIYVGVNWDNNLQMGKYIHPATKEQYDALMKAMNDAGYKWNAGTKTLEKLEKSSFHEGDWVVYNNDICQIVKREEGCNKLVTVFGIEKELVNERNLSTARLWTIQDAKDGDFLCCKSGWMCIFKSLNNHTNTFSSYCFMDSDKCFFNSGGECHTLDKEFINAYNGEIHPATKEQRDLLFQKIKEAGYKWNTETKTLEKLVEPKFKVGDWVVQNYNILKIRYVGNEYYCFETVDAYVDYMLVSEIDSLYHLWTIQDAKVGDVLEFGDHGRLVIGILSGINKTTGKVDVSCLLEDNKFKLGVFYNLDTVSPHPAIKEQRDILMKAMNDAGYKWNTRTKTLEKMVEPKFKVGDKIVNLPMKYMGGSWTQGTISKITDDKFIFTDGSYTSISSQDSWELVYDKKPKFDPKTLKPFDKVLVRDDESLTWKTNMFSYIDNNKKYPYVCLLSCYRYCIPYNDDTKHLVGTSDEAPEFYRYWED